MCVQASVCACVRASERASVRACVRACVYAWVRLCVCIFVPECAHTRLHMRARTHTRTHAHTRARAHTHTCVCVHAPTLHACMCVLVCERPRQVHENRTCWRVILDGVVGRADVPGIVVTNHWLADLTAELIYQTRSMIALSLAGLICVCMCVHVRACVCVHVHVRERRLL